MGADVNCKCAEQGKIFTNKSEAFYSINEINKQLEIFALQNKLMIYPAPVRKIIEKLFILRQEHICHIIIDLLKQKKKNQRELLLSDIERIDLQEFDNFFHQNQGKTSRQTLKNAEPQFCWEFTESMRISGEKSLCNDRVMIIATINCFQNDNCLAPTNLPSKKSPFEIFMEKVQALNEKYCTKVKTILITNEQLGAYRIGENALVVKYEPQFPCFSDKGKIASFGNRIIFPVKSGDIVSFVLHNPQIKSILEDVEYVCFSNVKNLTGPALGVQKLGWLIAKPQKSIFAQVYRKQGKIGIDNGFIDLQEEILGDCLVKKSFLLSINGSNSHKFIHRIEKQKMADYNNLFYFNRNLTKIFNTESTTIHFTDQYGFDVEGYTKYCEKRLGIEVSIEEEQYIEIDPQILYGKGEEIEKIVRELKGSQRIGFPLVIVKNRLSEF